MAQPTVLLPYEFGDGWMSKSARDLCKIAVAFGEFEADELARRLALVPSRGRSINVTTVENILDSMYREVHAPCVLCDGPLLATRVLTAVGDAHRDCVVAMGELFDSLR